MFGRMPVLTLGGFGLPADSAQVAVCPQRSGSGT